MINSVTVLTPNGRRQIVNVTPNSTVLQILEEVCKKHEFQPIDYDIRHHNTILDTTMTIQFSRLPNNAQLEMVKAKKIRKESEVLVNIQIESGSRISGTFLPSASLWEVVTQLCADSCGTSKLPTVLYMRQEISGVENLKATTLRSLGLTSGRALFRLTCKSVEGEVTYKLGVTSNPANYGVASTSNQKDSSDFNDSQSIMNKEGNRKEKVQKDSTTAKRTFSTGTVPKSLLGQKEVSPMGNLMPLSEEHAEQKNSQECSEKSNVILQPSVVNESTGSKKQYTETNRAITQGAKPKGVTPASQEFNSVSTLEEIFNEEIVPRDRNPVIFKHGSQQSSFGDDLPDEFFELTLDDVRNLFRDLKNKHSDMNESPLQTSALRKLEESKRILNQLHKYKRAVLRIQFPDQIILQGSFSPVETIESVHKFVQGYLQDPTTSFYLYTTPPKEILAPSSRLIEVNCVPCALLYFGVPDGFQTSTHYLRPEVLSELTSFKVATAAASQSRGLPAGSEKSSLPSTSGVVKSHASASGVVKSHASASGTQGSNESKGSGRASSSGSDRKQAENPNGKVPKWFKLGPQ